MPPDHAKPTPAAMPLLGRIGWLRGALGAMLGIALVGVTGRMALGADPMLPWIIAPIGASAVLLFVLPASPLSQPWPLFGGHVVSAAIGLALHQWFGADPLAVGLAVGLSIAAMSLLRCLHAPAGGTAVLTALASPAIVSAGWHFYLVPITLNAACLLAVGLIFNRLTGHPYPHHAAPAPAAPPGYTSADLEAVLEQWDEVLDVSIEDLDALFRAVEDRVRQRNAR